MKSPSKEMQKQLQKMMRVCDAGLTSHRSKELKKDLQKTCGQFLEVLARPSSMSTSHNQINLGAGLTPSKPGDSNQAMIMQCLLYLLVRQRTVKVLFVVRPSKARDTDAHGTLAWSGRPSIQLSQEFYLRLSEFIREDSGGEYVQRFFREVGFQIKLMGDGKAKINPVQHALYSFIEQFYKQVGLLFNQEKIYLMKNSLSLLQIEQLKSGENRADFLARQEQLLTAFKSIYSLAWTLKDLDISSLTSLAKGSPENNQIKEQDNEEVKYRQLGVFKPFRGTPTQYLEKIAISCRGSQQQLTAISRIIERTPNLTVLQVHNTSAVKVYQSLDYFLEKFVTFTQSIKRIYLKNIQVISVPNALLQTIYSELPFLVQLQLGLHFNYTISQTYEQGPLEERDIKERQREAQIILEALRLRNITLSHNYQLAKLLLKKQYTFLSALEIIDCIEPVCF